MCGICGVVFSERDRPIQPDVIRRMTRSLAHRGPDGEGIECEGHAGFGHRRLAIIDTSPMGRQPMTNEDGRYWIVLNGEIYNYLELRAELVALGHAFRSHTDTEVVLHLFEEEGPDCVLRLNGMFAFVIWDRQRHELFAARDRLGVKPFYYAEVPGGFVFGSEIKAILASQLVSPAIDDDGLADYLTFQFCLGDSTLFAGVRRLLPGHCLALGSGRPLAIRKYWDLDFTVDPSRSEEDLRESLLALLRDSVRLELRADVAVGAHLSGGLDSSAVCCLAAPLSAPPLHVFSGAFRGGPAFDETRYARAVAAHIGARHHEVYPTAGDFVRVMPSLIYHMDEPAAGPGLFPQFMVSELASRHVKVVLGGQGGDELFAGYSRYLVAYLEECIRGGIDGTQEDSRYVVTFGTIVDNLPQLQGYQPLMQHFWREGLFEPQHRRYFRLIDRSASLASLVTPDAFEPASGYRPFDRFRSIFDEGHAVSYINRMTHFDLKTLLPALLQVEDRTSMAVSIESRVPLLDHRVVELVASMPPRVKYQGGQSKHVFRQAVRGVVPEQVLGRKDKMGFPVPLDRLYREEPARSFVLDTLSSARARQRGLFRVPDLDGLLGSERAFGRGLWGVLSLELWMERFLDASQ